MKDRLTQWRADLIDWILIAIFLTALMPVVFAQTGADLSIMLSSDFSDVPVNTNFTYSVTVENLGISAATFVTTTDNLPAGISFLSSPDACVVSGAAVECSIGDLAVGETVTVTYMVRATVSGDDMDNSVSVLGAETDPVSDNNVASTSVTVVEPEAVDIVLSGSASPSIVDMSEEVELSFVVSNASAIAAYIAVVDIVLPSQVEFISSSDCVSTGTLVRCELGTVENSMPKAAVLTIRAIAPANPVTISAIASHFATDPDTANNGAILSFTVNEPPADSADLKFSMIPSAAQFIMGENLVITYSVTNLGPNDASNVRVIDEFPPEMMFVSSADCVLTGGLTVCDVGDLGISEIYTGSVTVSANIETPALSSSASAAGDEFDPNLFNNVQTLSLPSINPLAATPSPFVITATPGVTVSPVLISSTALVPVQEVSTSASVQASNVPGGQDAVPTASGNTGTSSSGAVKDSLPDGVAPSDIYGWTRYESVDLIQVSGQWHLRTILNASDDGYHESRDAGASLRYPFEGDGFRIGYRSEVNGAAIQINLDNEFMGIIMTDFMTIDPELNPIRQTFVTEPYWVDPGYHLIDLLCLADGQGSEACNIDYVEIFTGPPIPEAVQATEVLVPAGEMPIPVNDIELVSAPPTMAPTTTPIPASVVTVNVIVSVDLNANGQIDANEGIENLTVRAVDVSDNTLLATSVTDSSGFVRLSVSTTNDVILLIPVLGESFYVRNRTEAVEETWNLLLAPANVPGLVP